jgi:2,4-dienoyl-CoA reductase-like NADH-dependent reductase (Old Yellow Enzyme family)
MERHEFDLIAVGRALISDPQWVAKVRDGHVNKLNSSQRLLMSWSTSSVEGGHDPLTIATN